VPNDVTRDGQMLIYSVYFDAGFAQPLNERADGAAP